MAGRETYDRICNEMRTAMAHGRNDVDATSQLFMFADVVATVMDGIGNTSLGAVSNGVQALLGTIKGARDVPVPNPFFLQHGFEDLSSKGTQKYLVSRALKGGGAGLLSLVGDIASSHTAGVNVSGAAVDLHALGSTGVHMLKIQAIAKSNKQTYTIADWCSTIQKAKGAKVAVRAGSLAANVIPAGSLGVGIAVGIAKAGIKLTLNNLVYATAAQIHWRAFQEQRISGGLGKGTGGGVGPASRIFWEIFTKRGVTGLLGKYDIDRLVGEPGGWQALGDKLMNL